MTDDLEAQARDMLNPHRQLICGCMAITCPRVDRIAELAAAWARRLVAESQAAALREAAILTRETEGYPTSGILKSLADGFDALAAEEGRDA